MIYKNVVERALKEARVPYKANRRTISLLCPFHNDKDTPSLVIYTDKDPVNFYCFGCRTHGDWSKLAGAIQAGDLGRDWDDPAAFENMKQELHLLFSKDPSLPPGTRVWADGAWREFSAASLAGVHALWWFDDIDEVRRIVWPVWDRSSDLVGWVGRDLDGYAAKRKYRNMPHMKALHTLWPMPVDLRYPERTAVLVEGITDALRLLNRGIPALACLGTGWSVDRTALLADYLGVERVVLAYDGDDAGMAAADRVSWSLTRRDAPYDKKDLWIWEWSNGRDPGDADLEEVEELRMELRAPLTLHPWLKLTPKQLPLHWHAEAR